MRQHSQLNGHRLTDKLEAFLRTRPETPFLAMDGDVVLSKYLTMRACFPSATIYYAVKANPVPDLVALLAAVGAGFDISSRHELDLCLSLNVAAEQLSYGNPIKKADDIAYAYRARRALFRVRQSDRAREARPARTWRRRDVSTAHQR